MLGNIFYIPVLPRVGLLCVHLNSVYSFNSFVYFGDVHYDALLYLYKLLCANKFYPVKDTRIISF